jgi:large subunit ribosomal protein L3
MFKGIFGQKVGMTQVYDESGVLQPVTVIQAEPCVVVRTKSPQDREGYEAVVVGFGKAKKPSKPHAGQFAGVAGAPRRHLREMRYEGASDLEVGAELTVESFDAGDRVIVVGTSKGKGYAGTVKRHNFGRGPMSHGSKSHRRPGSTGATDAARVLKGVKKAGQMGNERVTVKGLRVVRVDAARNLLLISGSVPGSKGSIVEVRAVESFDEEI